MKALIAALSMAVASCAAAPATAQTAPDCMPFDTFNQMTEANGAEMVFIDHDADREIAIFLDPLGRWVGVINVDGMVCPVIGGMNGELRRPKPNV